MICLGLTLFINSCVFPQLPNWFVDSFRIHDGMIVPYGTSTDGLAISVLVTFVLLLPIFFMILIIVYFFTRQRSHLLSYLWAIPIQKISECVQNIPQKKISFFVLSTMISTMTVFTAVHITINNFLSNFSDLIKFFDLAGVYNNISIPFKSSEIASEALIGNLGIFAFLLFGTGPIWLLLIRWAKKEKLRHPGPRILLSYLYGLATILVFVQIGFFMTDQSQPSILRISETNYLHCSSDRSPTTILEFTLYGQTMICQPLNLVVIILTSFITSLFAYIVVSHVLHKM
jgi:hypothetical protein